MKNLPPDLTPNQERIFREARKLPVAAGLLASLSALSMVSRNVAGLKLFLDESTPMYAMVDDLERALTAIVHNQVEPLVEQVKDHPHKTFEDYDA